MSNEVTDDRVQISFFSFYLSPRSFPFSVPRFSQPRSQVLSYPPYGAGRREPWERGCVLATSVFKTTSQKLMTRQQLSTA